MYGELVVGGSMVGRVAFLVGSKLGVYNKKKKGRFICLCTVLGGEALAHYG